MDPHSTRIEEGVEYQSALTTPGTEATAPWITPRPIPRVGFTHTCHTTEVDTAPQSGGRWSASGGGAIGRVQPLCRPEGPDDHAAKPLSMAHPADFNVAPSQ